MKMSVQPVILANTKKCELFYAKFIVVTDIDVHPLLSCDTFLKSKCYCFPPFLYGVTRILVFCDAISINIKLQFSSETTFTVPWVSGCINF